MRITSYKTARYIALLIFFIYSLPAVAQVNIDYFNSEAFWKKLELDNSGKKPALKASDTVIIVASNRKMNDGDMRFMTEQREDSRVRYFVVYAAAGKWKLTPAGSLAAALDLIPDKNKDWVVYTEGMGKLFTTDLDRGLQMAGQYGVNVLLLDYPSISSTRKRLGNYYFAIKNARRAYRHFAPVLDSFQMCGEQGRYGNGHLTLFFHSMGNNVMRGIVKHGRLPMINNDVWVDNIILNAPCVPQRRHRKWVDKINFANDIYIHYNPKDYTLGGAHLVSLKKQLGEKVRRPLSRKAHYINFNTVAGKGHSNFLNIPGRNAISPACADHYNRLLHGNKVTLQDTSLYTPAVYRKIGYDLKP